MRTVEKKIWPEYFGKVLEGKKTFELRLNDFEIEEGDMLVLKEWDPNTKDYTGRQLSKKIGYVGRWRIDDLTKFWPKEEIASLGIQVISFQA